MKKYTNKILLITFIVVILVTIVGITIEFQRGVRNGSIQKADIEVREEYSEFPDSASVVIDEKTLDSGAVKTMCTSSLQKDEKTNANAE